MNKHHSPSRPPLSTSYSTTAAWLVECALVREKLWLLSCPYSSLWLTGQTRHLHELNMAASHVFLFGYHKRAGLSGARWLSFTVQHLGFLHVVCMGGSPYCPKEMALRTGVDIVAGTPRRVKIILSFLICLDFIVKGTLNLKCLKLPVHDEADEMLNMGFVDNIALILGTVEDATKVQTLVFSATLPDWVNKLSMRFLKVDRKIVDLVGNEKLKTSACVKHLAVPFKKAARAQFFPDII